MEQRRGQAQCLFDALRVRRESLGPGAGQRITRTGVRCGIAARRDGRGYGRVRACRRGAGHCARGRSVDWFGM
jgi:hypothetical protein